MQVNPAGTGGKSHVLPWEVSRAVRTNRTTSPATVREGSGEVSRGHSSPRVGGRRAESSIARNRLGDSMGVEGQHGMGDQLYLWEELAPVRPGVSGKGGIRASACEEQQTSAASI